MAIPLLLGASCHTVAYDLESLFYALLYVVTHVPNSDNRLTSACIGVDDWFRQPSLEALAALKLGQLNYLMQEFLSGIHPKFAQLIPYICALWQVLYPLGLPRDTLVVDRNNIEAFDPGARVPVWLEPQDCSMRDLLATMD
ncbi:hypothetical protein H0H92_007694 [Tricholoma furcatifolium]|nr:hypothetical protein H0H92_007694 [Tricholoma furcatifolium]